ncbi:MAG: hypothetical protein IH946_02775 [Bacteroidetes bacterium]|nr:hypothetical protein [Bacteroidota bacterium]
MTEDWEAYEFEQWKETIRWEEYMEWAEEHDLPWGQLKFIKAMFSYRASWKQIRAAKGVIEKIDEMREAEETD